MRTKSAREEAFVDTLSVDILCKLHDGRLSPITHAVLMRARESSGLLALFPTSPEAVARGVLWR